MIYKTIWVVTFSPLGEQKGEFFREVAYGTATAAMPDCIACMQQHGGRETYDERYIDHQELPHVSRAWNGKDTTVWLEMLKLSME